MEGLSITCPVCGTKVSSNWNCCHNCGFEIRILPDNANDSVRTYEEIRINTAKRKWQIDSHIVEDKIREKDVEIQKKDEEIQTLNQTIAQKDQVIYAKTKELNEKEKALNKKISQVEQLTKDMAVYAGYHKPEVVDQLQKQISGLKEQLSKQQFSNSASSVVAYLIQFDDDEAQNIYALTEGDNSFGSAPNKTGHKQVLTGDLQLIHFTIHSKVEKSVNRKRVSFTVTPNQGGIAIDNKFAKQITNGTLELDMNADLYAGGLHFRLLPNKDFK